MFEFIATDPSNFDLTNGKTVSQSTTFNDNDVQYGPANAVDRDANTFSHTKSSDSNPFWSVDLGGSREVAIVSITNRYCGDVTDPNNCLGRLSEATVELLDSGDNVVAFQSFGDTTGALSPFLDFNTCVSNILQSC